MAYLIQIIAGSYQRLYRAYLAVLEEDPVRAKWIYEFAPLATLSVFATILFFTNVTLLWAIGLWGLYFPLWIAIYFNSR